MIDKPRNRIVHASRTLSTVTQIADRGGGAEALPVSATMGTMPARLRYFDALGCVLFTSFACYLRYRQQAGVAHRRVIHGDGVLP